MMVVASLPIALVLGVGLLCRARVGARDDSGGLIVIQALGVSGAGLALLVTLFAWTRGTRGASGTLDGDPFSLYCSALLLGLLLVVLVSSRLDPTTVERLCISTVFLLLVVSTRDLLWIGVALTLLTMSLSSYRLRAGVGVACVPFWTGAILLVSVGGRSDLATIGGAAASLPLKLGIGLTFVGVAMAFVVLNARCWVLDVPAAVRGYLSAGAWIATTAVWIRLSVWLDVSAWSRTMDLLGAVALCVGSLGVLLSTRIGDLGRWFLLAQAGFAFVAVGLGVDAVPALLLHLAAGTMALVLSLLALEVSGGGVDLEINELAGLTLSRFPGLVLALGWLTFTSLPPFPGFVSKFPILVSAVGAEKTGLLAVLVAATMLVAIGFTRWASRILKPDLTASSRDLRFDEVAVAALAVAFNLALGVLPEPAIEVASRAAAGLF